MRAGAFMCALCAMPTEVFTTQFTFEVLFNRAADVAVQHFDFAINLPINSCTRLSLHHSTSKFAKGVTVTSEECMRTLLSGW